MSEESLTEQQKKVLDFVQQYAEHHGFAPSLREIGQGLGLASVNAVRGHVAALERKGFITKESDKARSIRLVAKPSILSRFRRRLHDWAHTDEGVLHGIVYGLAWSTWRRTPYFTGQRLQWLEKVIEHEAVERGWTILDKRIEADHLVLVLKVWPNHSAEQTVRRLRLAGRAMKLRHLAEFPGEHLWGRGYVATTDLDLLDEMVAQLLADQQAGDP
jgi:REP element-mobilizing transposase RayT